MSPPPGGAPASQEEKTDTGLRSTASRYFGMYFTIYSDKSSAMSFSAGLNIM